MLWMIHKTQLFYTYTYPSHISSRYHYHCILKGTYFHPISSKDSNHILYQSSRINSNFPHSNIQEGIAQYMTTTSNSKDFLYIFLHFNHIGNPLSHQCRHLDIQTHPSSKNDYRRIEYKMNHNSSYLHYQYTKIGNSHSVPLDLDNNGSHHNTTCQSHKSNYFDLLSRLSCIHRHRHFNLHNS